MVEIARMRMRGCGVMVSGRDSQDENKRIPACCELSVYGCSRTLSFFLLYLSHHINLSKYEGNCNLWYSRIHLSLTFLLYSNKTQCDLSVYQPEL